MFRSRLRAKFDWLFALSLNSTSAISYRSMDSVHFKEIETNNEVRKNLAKWITHDCFRNTSLEALHDRISQDEMKQLMKEAVDNAYYLLTTLFSASDYTNRAIDLLKSKENLTTEEWSKWDDPVLSRERMKIEAQIFKRVQERRSSS
jgi:hypothetical protein